MFKDYLNKQISIKLAQIQSKLPLTFCSQLCWCPIYFTSLHEKWNQTRWEWQRWAEVSQRNNQNQTGQLCQVTHFKALWPFRGDHVQLGKKTAIARPTQDVLWKLNVFFSGCLYLYTCTYNIKPLCRSQSGSWVKPSARKMRLYCSNAVFHLISWTWGTNAYFLIDYTATRVSPRALSNTKGLLL